MNRAIQHTKNRKDISQTEESKGITIYYFSGTGNSAAVAQWISAMATQRGEKCDLINLSLLQNRKNIEITDSNIIGFISPTHGFNFPPLMFHFILRFPKIKTKKAFIINTRAGMKMGKLFLPGLSGMTQYLSAFILKCKGSKIVGMHPIDLPSNWISVHPGLKEKVIESIYLKRKKETEEFATKILDGQKDLKALKDLLQDLIITPIAFLYYFAGRFFLAKSFFASGKCTKCDLCIKECPVGAIKTVDKRPFWTYRCESCMQCMNRCPERAIETAHGYFIGLYVLVNSVIMYQLYALLNINDFMNSINIYWIERIVTFLFDSLVFFTFLFISYRIIHYLMRFRFFERMMVYTSLTSLKLWRRYWPRKSS